MAVDKTNQNFYRDVDQYRHKAGCGMVGLAVLCLALIAVIIWVLVRKYFL